MAEENNELESVKTVENENIAPELDEIPGYVQVREAAAEYLSIGKEYDWMVEVFAVLLLTAVFSFCVGMVLRAVSKTMTKTASHLDFGRFLCD